MKIVEYLLRLRTAPLVLLLVVGGGGHAAAADESGTPREVRVQPGETALIASSSNPITLPQDSRIKGEVWIVPASAGEPSALFYVAPREPEPFSMQLKYKDGESPKEVKITVGPAPPSPGDDTYEESFKILFALFVLAVLMESGLAVIFNWRVYQTIFAGGVKTPVTLAFAILLVCVFRLDLTTTLVNLYSTTNFAPGPAGKLLTALVLAGGSSGVNKILVALGFRSVKPVEERAPKPPADKGWISVRYTGTHAGPITVMIGGPASLEAVGEISASRAHGRLRGLFLRDATRFPPSGGYTYPASKVCRIELKDRAQETIAGATWGPYPIGASAILDVELS